jgi:hypothetical protein
MRKLLAVAFAVVLFQSASLVQAADFSFNINVGGPPVVISQPPDFLYPPELGYGVAVGVPYDMFYISGLYYIYRGGGWYRTNNYGGSWVKLRHRELPPELRRYKIARIHEYRDREYRVYTRDRDHYRGRYYRPGRAVVEERRDMRGPGREERRDMRGPGREERREERHDMRDQRPEHGRDQHQGGRDQNPNEGGGDRREHERAR